MIYLHSEIEGLWSPNNVNYLHQEGKRCHINFQRRTQYISLNMFLETKCVLILCGVNKNERFTHRYVLFLFIATPTTGAWWQRGCAETAAPDAGHRSAYSQKRQNWNFHPDGVLLMTLARDPPGLIRPQPTV